MQCPRCNHSLEEEATFCGFCGTQIAPFQAKGATIRPPADDAGVPAAKSNFAREQIETVQNSPGIVERGFPAWQAPLQRLQQLETHVQAEAPVSSRQAKTTPQAPLPPVVPPARETARGNRPRITLLIVLILLIIAGGTIAGALALKNAAAPTTS